MDKNTRAKSAFTYAVYRRICQIAAMDENPTFLYYCHSAWTAIGRSVSISEHTKSSLCMADDAKTKTDQGGKKAEQIRHIFSNPLEPEINYFLSLGLLTLTFEGTNDKIFKDADPKAVFTTWLHKTLNGSRRQYLQVVHSSRVDTGWAAGIRHWSLMSCFQHLFTALLLDLQQLESPKRLLSCGLYKANPRNYEP